MPETLHIVTGATGLLGASVILELAHHTSDRLLCLARPGPSDPGVRVRQALQQTAHAYDLPPLRVEEAMRRTTALVHDVLDEGGPDLPPAVGRPDSVRVWHMAAHTNLSERARRRCFAANVGGTRRLLALARRWGAESFSYMSTAQVAGLNQGVIEERPVEVARPRNGYEASKISAERLVESVDDMAVQILRPSAVIGHSLTSRYPGRSSGVYTLQQVLAAYLRSQGTPRGDGPLRIVARAGQPFNLVPVDRVVREAVRVGTTPGARGVFHLTNPAPPSVGDVLGALVDNAGGPPVVCVESFESLSEADRRLHRKLGVFSAYVNNGQYFERTRTDSVGGPGPADPPLDREALRRHLRDWAVPRAAAVSPSPQAQSPSS